MNSRTVRQILLNFDDFPRLWPFLTVFLEDLGESAETDSLCENLPYSSRSSLKHLQHQKTKTIRLPSAGFRTISSKFRMVSSDFSIENSKFSFSAFSLRFYPRAVLGMILVIFTFFSGLSSFQVVCANFSTKNRGRKYQSVFA